MCGIAGIAGDPSNLSAEKLADLGHLMAGTLDHRGPDDQGVWVNEADSVVLAHRRLAVVDLSSAGRQPMLSACGRWVIVYNGELYNSAKIRERLDGRSERFRYDSNLYLPVHTPPSLR